MTEVERGGLERTAERLVEQVLRVGIDGAGPVKGAVVVAEENLERAGGDAEFAEKRLIATHVRLATTSGFVTGAGGLVTSIVTIPTGLAGLYVISTRMVAGIAHLRGYDVGSEDVRSAILVSLLGSGAAAALGGVGIEIGQKSALAAVRRVPGRALINLNKRVGYRLITRAGTKGSINLTKVVPLVGAPIGATVDGMSCRGIARYAQRAFPRGPGLNGSP